MFAKLIRAYLIKENDSGRPVGIEVEQHPDSLTIKYRNLHLSRYSGLSGAIFLNIVFALLVWSLVFGDQSLLRADDPEPSGLLQRIKFETVAVFLVVSVSMLWLTYRSAVRLCNTITFAVRPDGATSVVSAPIPTSGNISVDTASIAQLFCKEHIRGQEGASRVSEAPFRAYTVCAELTSGEEIRLARGLGTFAAASFVCTEIETYLGLEDRPVAGEARRGSREKRFGE